MEFKDSPKWTPSAPIFPTQNYFRWKYLRTIFVSVSLSFKYKIDHIKGLIAIMDPYYNLRTMKGNFLLGTSWMAHHKPSCDIWLKTYAEKKTWQIFVYFKCQFHNERLHSQIFRFLDIFWRSLHFFPQKNSSLRDQPFCFLVKNTLFFYIFRWQNICWKIFAVCQLLKKDWDVFVQKWAHTDFLLLNICISYNAMA